MADWELFLGVVFATAWSTWYTDILRVNRFAAPRQLRSALAVLPAICFLLFATIIHFYGAQAVRDNAAYTLYYVVMGAGWLGILRWVIPLLGVSPRDDVLERRNKAALLSTVAALLAFALCYAGGNVGEGPGAHAVLASAGLATLSLLVLWFVLEVSSGNKVSESITVERDTGAGIRLAGFLLCNGAILGAAAAGDWIPGNLLVPFVRFAWPTLLVTAAAIITERISRAGTRPARSAFIALVLLIFGCVYAFLRVSLQ